MKTHAVHNLMKNLLILLVYVFNIDAVPPNYCLYPLNTSDCNLRPLAVFYYYKSGSRCEIGYWRGCPTYNKFANQYDCTDMCIYHYNIRPGNETVGEPPLPLTDDIMSELMDLPAENLTAIEEIIDQVAEENSRIKLHVEVKETTEEPTTEAAKATAEPEAPEPPGTDAPTTEAPPTDPPSSEPTPTEAPATTPTSTTKKESDESGLPDEVELP